MSLLEFWYISSKEALSQAHTDQLRQHLSPEEEDRCRKLIRGRDRRNFILARSMVRAALSAHTNHPETAWRFEEDPQGKPRVANPPPGTPEFSISHTDGLVACAVHRGGAVGVDVEALDRGPRIRELALACFAESEREHLEVLNENTGIETAVWMWTAKEAIAKAQGKGVGRALASIVTTGYPHRSTNLSLGTTHWKVVPVGIEGTHLGSVAVPGGAPAGHGSEQDQFGIYSRLHLI